MLDAMALAGPRRTETTSSSGAVGALTFFGSWAGMGWAPVPASVFFAPSRATVAGAFLAGAAGAVAGDDAGGAAGAWARGRRGRGLCGTGGATTGISRVAGLAGADVTARDTVGRWAAAAVKRFEQGPPFGIDRILVLLVTLVQFVNEPLVSAKFLW